MDNADRVYLEFNYVNFEDAISEAVEKLWKLNTSDPQTFHAEGVAYCYCGEDINQARRFIERAIKTHSILNKR